MNYGESLKYHRENAGLSQLQLSKKINTSHQNINRWEANKVLPNIDFCVMMADFYGITLDELVGRETKDGYTNYNKNTNINITIK